MRTAVSLGLILAAGCAPDQELYSRVVDSVGVSMGDFDDVTAPLNRMVVKHTTYDGVISVATWDEDYDAESVSRKVEGLLGSYDELALHDTVMIASGTRGCGVREYNGLNADDHLVTDPAVLENLREYVRRGGTVVATDWSYDLIEAAWPDYIDFHGDDEAIDSAQRGEITTVTAEVANEQLAFDLDQDQVALSYNFSNWAVPESVSPEASVWFAGDVEVRLPDGAGVEAIGGAPLLVSFEPYGPELGRVVYASFHFDAQTAEVLDTTLRTVVGDFKEDVPDAQSIEE